MRLAALVPFIVLWVLGASSGASASGPANLPAGKAAADPARDPGAPLKALVPDAADAGRITFRVMRGGREIGTHQVTLRRQGDALHAHVEIDLKVRFGFLTVFRYSHRSHEIWRAGRLIQLESWTDDDGTEQRVNARARGDALEVVGPSGRIMVPGDIIPTSYWHAGLRHARQLLDTQRGRILNVAMTQVPGTQAVSAAGRRVPARQFTMAGDLRLDIWYSPGGAWVKLAFETRGAQVTYVPRSLNHVTARTAAR